MSSGFRRSRMVPEANRSRASASPQHASTRAVSGSVSGVSARRQGRDRRQNRVVRLLGKIPRRPAAFHLRTPMPLGHSRQSSGHVSARTAHNRADGCPPPPADAGAYARQRCIGEPHLRGDRSRRQPSFEQRTKRTVTVRGRPLPLRLFAILDPKLPLREFGTTAAARRRVFRHDEIHHAPPSRR